LPRDLSALPEAPERTGVAAEGICSDAGAARLLAAGDFAALLLRRISGVSD
jgi:hypothetical protein